LRCFQILIGSLDPDALKIAARGVEYSLTESAFSPFQAELTQFIIDIFGTEHDSFASSLKDFTFYMVGATVGIVVATVK
jgi:hypothetical protein